MKTWFTSLSGALTLSAIALLTELWRSFVDLLVPVYPYWTEPFRGAGMVFLVTMLYTILFAAWGWGLLQALRGGRGALTAAFIINLFSCWQSPSARWWPTVLPPAPLFGR